jgi:hypothetical protein
LLYETRRVLREWNAKGLVKAGYRAMHPAAECQAKREPVVLWQIYLGGQCYVAVRG